MSNIAIISGSHRPSGNSPRIARHIEAELKKRGHSTFLLDLSQNSMPFWDEGVWGAELLKDKWAKEWTPLQKEFEKAEGLVIISPEYHGQVPSKLINLLLMFGNATGPVAHKPALLIGVSSSGGGTYPVDQLRAHGGKNNRLAFLPDHLLIRGADHIFSESSAKPEHAATNAIVQERLSWNLTQLEDYIPAFNQIRKAGHATHEKFPNGM